MAHKQEWIYLDALSETLLTFGIIFGPLIGFVSQYNLVKSTKSLGSFSTDVCGILIFANILRIFFWFGKFFEVALLLQSIFMVLMQFILLQKCLEVKKIDVYKDQKTTIFCIQFKMKNIQAFWRWHNVSSYVLFVGIFVLALCILNIIFGQNYLYWETLGFLSSAIEASLGIPQAYQNHKTKSTQGLSQTMIGSWVFGDLFKTFYYLFKKAPMQFIVCGFTQLAVDFLIIAQVAVMGKNVILEL